MGVWGSGLYSGDFAADLRSTIGAVTRLPHESGRLVDILCETEPNAANNPDDPDHTIFWLVAADQFAKRGIASDRVREKALAIIDSDSDIALHAKLGMSASDLNKRKKTLEDLRTRITAPLPSKPRPVLKKPQPLLMNVGEVLVYPTFGGRCRNPYFASPEMDRMGTAAASWRADSWSAMVVVDCGRAFDFLAWYRPITISAAVEQKPAIEMLLGEVLWKLVRPGTCSAAHFKRMGLEKIGKIDFDRQKLERTFPGMKPGIAQAVQDISIANQISVGPRVQDALTPRPVEPLIMTWGRTYPAILGIGQILST